MGYLDQCEERFVLSQWELQEKFEDALESPHSCDSEKKCLFALFLAVAKDDDGQKMATSLNHIMRWIRNGRQDGNGWYTMDEEAADGNGPIFASGSNNSTIKRWIEDYMHSGDLEELLRQRKKGAKGHKPAHTFKRKTLEKALKEENHPRAKKAIAALIFLLDKQFKVTSFEVTEASGINSSSVTELIKGAEMASQDGMPLEKFLKGYRKQTRTMLSGKEVSRGGCYQIRMQPAVGHYISSNVESIKGDKKVTEFYWRCAFDWVQMSPSERQKLSRRGRRWVKENFPTEGEQPFSTARFNRPMAEKLEKIRQPGESDNQLVANCIVSMTAKYEDENAAASAESNSEDLNIAQSSDHLLTATA